MSVRIVIRHVLQYYNTIYYAKYISCQCSYLGNHDGGGGNGGQSNVYDDGGVFSQIVFDWIGRIPNSNKYLLDFLTSAVSAFCLQTNIKIQFSICIKMCYLILQKRNYTLQGEFYIIFCTVLISFDLPR